MRLSRKILIKNKHQEKEIEDIEKEILKLRNNLESNFSKADEIFLALKNQILIGIENNSKAIEEEILNQPLELVGSWDDPRWMDWSANKLVENYDTSQEYLLSRASDLCIGVFAEQKHIGRSLNFPAYAPFIGNHNTIIFKTNDMHATKGQEFLNSVICRTALLLPFQSEFVLLDPSSLGMAFPMQKFLPNLVKVNQSDINIVLSNIIQYIQGFIQTYLDGEISSFEQLPADIRTNLKLKLIFAANFPRKYDRRAIEDLQTISNSGTRSGVYLFIHYNTDEELPRDGNMNDFSKPFNISFPTEKNGEKKIGEFIPFLGEKAPEPRFYRQILGQLKELKQPQKSISFEKSLDLQKIDWWSGSSVTIIETIIGRHGANAPLKIWFGKNQQGQECAHALLGGMPGSGKSVTSHVSITGLCMRYSPDELNFYLIDGKLGAEFQVYKNLPHARLILLHSTPELARNALTEILTEMKRRYDLFRKIGVHDYKAYRESTRGGKLPRLLLMTDEYQVFFENDKEGRASENLLQISQQGRAAGIHLWLSSQSFGVQNMLHKDKVFSNIHLRMALQLSQQDAIGLGEFEREGKREISGFNKPGMILVNDQVGKDIGNKVGRTAYLPFDDVKKYVEEIHEYYIQQVEAGNQQVVKPTILLDGTEQPVFIDNPHIHTLITNERHAWPTDFEKEEFARKSIFEDGLQVSDWYQGEKPNVLWIGKDYDIYKQAYVILRQKNNENILVTGGNNSVIYGMMAAMAMSLVLNNSPNEIEFTILDRSQMLTQWTNTFPKLTTDLFVPLKYKVELFQESELIEQSLVRIIESINARKSMREPELFDQPRHFIFMLEPHRIRNIIQDKDPFEAAPQNKTRLLEILKEGSEVGVHLIASICDSSNAADLFKNRTGLDYFSHRILLQMSEDQSFQFLGNLIAASLQKDGDRPISAIYKDVSKNVEVKFKPYSTDSENFFEQYKTIGALYQNAKI